MIEVHVQEQRAWHDIVTVDESWFYDSTDQESICLRPGEKVPEMTRVSVPVQCKKWIVTIVWNPTGFQGIRILPKGCKFNSSYYQSEILESLSSWRSGQAGAAGGTLIVHADDARPHRAAAAASQQFMEEKEMARGPDPPYSPDLAPSDFYLFG
jgi:histone-lysine N-methyltransferase SETMAR